MIERPVGYVALSLPFVAVVVEAARSFPNGWIPVAVAAALTYAIALASLDARDAVGLWNVVPFALILVAAELAFVDPRAFGPWGPEIAVGALLGVPLLLVAYVARETEPLGIRCFVYGVAVTWGLLLLADVPLAVGSASNASLAFLSGFFSLAAEQFRVFGGLIPGAATPTLPLNALFNPTYAALTAVSLAGFLLVTTRPQTGGARPLPVAVRVYRDLGVGDELSPVYGFSAAQREVFRARTPGDSPFLTWPPGLEPIFYGAATAAALLAAAFFAPKWAVLGVTVGVALACVVLVRWTDRPRGLPVPKLRQPAKPAATDSDARETAAPTTGREPTGTGAPAVPPATPSTGETPAPASPGPAS